jgi:hypothetical protein
MLPLPSLLQAANVLEFVELAATAYLTTSVARQLDAMRLGFEHVFPARGLV